MYISFLVCMVSYSENSKNTGIPKQKVKIAGLRKKDPQPTGKNKWATTLRSRKNLGITSVVRSIQNPRDVVRCKIHRP